MMRRRLVPGIGAVLLAVITAAPAGANDVRDTRCSPGFNLGALTLEERLLFEKVQAGLAAGFYTVEQIAAVTDFVDKNDNGLVCVQIIPQRDGAALPSGWIYYANTTDDNAAGRL